MRGTLQSSNGYQEWAMKGRCQVISLLNSGVEKASALSFLLMSCHEARLILSVIAIQTSEAY